MLQRIKKLIGYVTILMCCSSAGASELIFQHEKGLDIEDDPFICNPIERNKFKEFQANLKKRYNTTIEKAYFDIECNNIDVLGIVIESAASRYNFTLHMEFYLKKINQPELLSRMILNKVDARDLLSRLDIELWATEKAGMADTIEEERLLKLKQKYTQWLKKYPVTKQ